MGYEVVVSSRSLTDATQTTQSSSEFADDTWTRYPIDAAAHALTPEGVGEKALVAARWRQLSHTLQLVVKRVVDVVLALGLLAVLSPVLLLTAVAIKLDSPGPLFFNRVRVGKNGCHFTMYKFRTMSSDAERRLRELQHLNEGGAYMVKIKDDPRVTRVGRLLRASSIDELPQLLNVLLGDMSIIGPRPQTPAEVAHYTEAQRVRLTVLPGITGLWQVKDRHNPSFEQWIAWDVHYIARWSLWLDLCIACQTFVIIIADIRRVIARSFASKGAM